MVRSSIDTDSQISSLLSPSHTNLVHSVTDDSGSRRRIHLSSSQRELSATPLNARIPLGELLADQVVMHVLDYRMKYISLS